MRRERHRCKECGELDEVVGHISKRGLCAPCGAERMEAAAHQLAAGAGPVHARYMQRWSEGMLAYMARNGLPLDKSGNPYQ